MMQCVNTDHLTNFRQARVGWDNLAYADYIIKARPAYRYGDGSHRVTDCL